MSVSNDLPIDTDIAIIGMAAHLPGAQSVSQFWDNLRAGNCAIRRLGQEELRAAGEAASVIGKPNYVPFAAPLQGFAEFDAEFFGFSPKDAAILDPQHRQFLETAWEAFEDAGHPPAAFPGPVGVFAGCGMGSYFYFNLCSNPDLVADTGLFLLRHTGNDKDFLSTRVSHVFDLRGPSVTVQTACSTSLVAVHQAVQSLLGGECDMALAGGVTIELPQGRGYLHKENEILSPDGQCHAFDHRAQGTVFGSGAGAVVLRRLADALADGDRVIAVIRGTAINNDGARKASYLAPSVEGQARAIAEAHAVAGISAQTISYVECHGTGTALGDPIEIAALTEAFFQSGATAPAQCRIGSVKTNIGHLDTAAGVASLIKVALALQHRELPPSLGYEAPNPAIDFPATPFVVNDSLTPWQAKASAPLRAGVNSLGVGGTNAHVIVEEAPVPMVSEPGDWPFQPLVLSARTGAALDQATANLAAHLHQNHDQPLADIAFTLKAGRSAFAQRRVVVAESHDTAADLLARKDTARVFTHQALDHPEIVFMFPGGGAQYPCMAQDLYATEPVFAEWMGRGLAHLQPQVKTDLRALWLPTPDARDTAAAQLRRPSLQLPLILITEIALAKMFMNWGVQPSALLGHSMGENAAACLAGVIGFEDCIDLVLLRGRLFDSVAAGGMLSVPLSPEALRKHLTDGLDIASINAPELTVVSGPEPALDELAQRLARADIMATPIAIDIAAHSRMLDPILDAFRAFVQTVPLHAPQIPIISNRTGQPLTAEQATDPDYWVSHLRETVQFAECLSTLSQRRNRIYLEMGPGKALSALTRMHGAIPAQQILSALRHMDEVIPDDLHHVGVLARIWALGGTFDWDQIWGEARRQRVALPTYPFQRSHYFIEPGETAPKPAALERSDDLSDWGQRLHWKPSYPDCEIDVTRDLSRLSETWLILADDCDIAAPVISALRQAGQRVVETRVGDIFARKADDLYTLPPEQGPESYAALLQDLIAQGKSPSRIGHFWLADQAQAARPGSNLLHQHIERGFASLLGLVQALQSENAPMPVHLTVVTQGAQALPGEALPFPEKALIAGPLRVAPHEVPGLTCSSLDIAPDNTPSDMLTTALLEELCATPANATALIRGTRRYQQVIRPAPLPESAVTPPHGAHWLITGGLGGIGLTLAADLAQMPGAKITLISRTALPAQADWATWLARNPARPGLAARMRAVQAILSNGGQVQVLKADVTNLEEMRAAIDHARALHGPIHGVIHAAGDLADAPILGKSPAQIERVLAPKLHGLQVLDTLLPDGSIDMMVLCSSSSTVTAPAGQVDYVAANEYLNAYATARAGQKTRVISLNWGPWAETGMTANLLQGGAAQDMPQTPCTQPLFDTQTPLPGGSMQFDLTLRSDHWLVDEHRTAAGQAVLPGTAVLDMAAQALRAQLPDDSGFALENVWFIRPLTVTHGGARHLRMTLHPQGEGFGFRLLGDIDQDGPGMVLQAQGQIRPLAAPATATAPAPERIDLDAIAARCPAKTETPALPQSRAMQFGPRWHSLGTTATGAGEGLAILHLPASFADDLQAGHVLHPALLDMATGWALDMVALQDPSALWVPVSYDALHLFRALPADLASHAVLRDGSDAVQATFDITLTLPDGTVIGQIDALTFRRLDGAAMENAAPIGLQEIERDTAGTPQPMSPAQEALREILALGITRAEGPQAFLRALGRAESVLHVSPLDLETLLTRAAAAPARSTAPRFQRSESERAHLPPRTRTEAALAALWQEYLGLDQIGVDENFFDLGGHSLIAMRLFAQVRKRWSVDLPLSVLFEAPTIEALAQRIGQDDDPPDTATAKPAPPGFRHVVPLCTGPESGPAGTPLFIVAGMFGNVLNLRHIALLLGQDRPVYGLQARGLLGDDAPHTRIEDAAADYIAELRQVQPHGPYCLGGFSGGGITAYEMARQLEQAGETVQIVMLLDTPLPQMPRLSRMDKALIKISEFRKKGPGYLGEWWRARRDWQATRAAGPAPDTADGFRNAAIEAAFRQAVGAYRLHPWDGNLVLLRPPLERHWKVTGGRWVNRQRDFVHEDNDWGRFATHLRVIKVPGDHDSMVLEPNVRVLAARMRDLLASPASPMKEAAE